QGEVSDVGPDHVALLLETKPEAVSFHFGLPEPEIIEAIKAAGIFIVSSATTVAEARLLEKSGVDAIIAQGIEAGGHRATFTGGDVSMQPGLVPLRRLLCWEPARCRSEPPFCAAKKRRCSMRTALHWRRRAMRPPW